MDPGADEEVEGVVKEGEEVEEIKGAQEVLEELAGSSDVDDFDYDFVRRCLIFHEFCKQALLSLGAPQRLLKSVGPKDAVFKNEYPT